MTNESMIMGYRMILGRMSGLHHKSVGELVRLTEYRREIMDLLRVRYFLVSPQKSRMTVRSTQVPDDAGPPWSPRDTFLPISETIYENPLAYPLVFPVLHWQISRDPVDIRRFLLNADLTASAVLDSDPGIASGSSPSTDPSGSVIDLTRFEAHRLACRVRLSADALLVFSEVAYPGWNAWLDGAPVPVRTADLALRAVPVPRGDHDLEMRFRPVSFLMGGYLSCLAAFWLACATGLHLRPPATRKTMAQRFHAGTPP